MVKSCRTHWLFFLAAAIRQLGDNRIISAFSLKVGGLRVDKASLRTKDPASAYSFVLSSAMDLMGNDNYYSRVNFLATQVWPSARVAASQIEKHAPMINAQSFCELGCGPGLPSITAAKIGISYVWATDIDEFALSLARAAAEEQGLVVKTRTVDLLSATNLPDCDLYVLSDVFESAAVARGAARICKELLRKEKAVWVFAQSDRVQREVFLRDMKQRLGEDAMEWSLKS
ncbi:hypothetical protein FisN_6Lu254 [Fistulifera solaris]|uniref:Methyltransferase type 11 domain-containing protein n=1 Tax=Fistulifera solaris TaxID=1519565 RepID=A0A1Z5J5W2_FISSO|nr:hypothetical protein FisN_6Lu254 [Fistulifera solaris]|eukprot:GAX09385.1 hypothetical protein FisN_6Lu254 [Fistulifera solaris]